MPKEDIKRFGELLYKNSYETKGNNREAILLSVKVCRNRYPKDEDRKTCRSGILAEQQKSIYKK